MVELFLTALFLHNFDLPRTYTVVPQQDQDAPAVGMLEVSIRRPQARSFRPGSQRIAVLELTLKASCEGDIPVHSITVQRRGMGSREDILSVYAVEGYERLSNGAQLLRDGTASIALRQFAVPACKQRRVIVLADIASDAATAGEHWFTITGPAAIEAAAASIRFQESDQAFEPQRAAGEAQGSIAVEYPRLLTTVRYGEAQAVLRIRLRADGTEDHAISAIVLTNQGTARGNNLQNISIEAGPRERVTSVVPQLTNARVRLIFDPPLLLRKNQERLLTVRADVRSSRSRTIRLIIEEPGDIEAETFRGERGS